MIKRTLQKRTKLPRGRFASLVLLCGLLSFSVSELQAQRRTKKEQGGASAGLRVAPFSTVGDISESLPDGIGVQLYYDQPFSFFLSGKLPSYMPASIQAVLNFETLSGEQKDEETAGLTIEKSLNRTGLELGPRWYFPFGTSQGLSLIALVGIASETAKKEISNDSEVITTEEKSGAAFSSHFLVNYEYHTKAKLLFSGGLSMVYGADKESPLIGIGLNLGLGYQF